MSAPTLGEHPSEHDLERAREAFFDERGCRHRWTTCDTCEEAVVITAALLAAVRQEERELLEKYKQVPLSDFHTEHSCGSFWYYTCRWPGCDYRGKGYEPEQRPHAADCPDAAPPPTSAANTLRHRNRATPKGE